jgi:hypothetical protein
MATQRHTRRPTIPKRVRLRQPAVTRREINAQVRRLEVVERRVDDLRAIALSLVRDSMARAALQKLPSTTTADIEKRTTMKRLLEGSEGS